MDRAKVFKDYFVSSQNTVLIPNEEFGRRKFINVGVNRSLSLSKIEEIERNHIGDMRSGNKQWIHPPESITRGHILYTVKFYGECEVESPKGTDVVKDAIRKRKFNKTLRKTEGQKTPKVELCISVDGVTIQEPKSKIIKHQYALHRISYCADDKSDKRMFTFIAKASDSNKHYCYVFASDKNAEEITLTIGQAFDLAYKRFLETQGKDVDVKKQQIVLQKKVENLERENAQLKARIRELEQLKDRTDLDSYKQNKQISDLTSISTPSNIVTLQNMIGERESSTDSPTSSQPSSPKLSPLGRNLESLMFEPSLTTQNDITNGSSSSPRAPGIISPPPPSTRSRTKKPGTPGTPATPTTPPPIPQRSTSNLMDDDLASVFMNSHQQNNVTNNNTVSNPFMNSSGSTFGQNSADPFGMTSFSPDGKSTNNMSEIDKDFLDVQAGFSQGLSFGTGDFGMDDFTS
ncbi:PTB domain-containing engulfment adapter protein 1 [Mactra antiquata]